MMKKLTVFLLILFISFPPSPSNAQCILEAKDITVLVNGEKVMLDVSPQVIDHALMLPVRPVMEALRAKVFWNGELQCVWGYNETYWLSFYLNGDSVAERADILAADSEFFTLSPKPLVINDRVFISAQQLADFFHCYINWYGETKTIDIIERKKIQ